MKRYWRKEEHYRMLFLNNPIPLWVYDRDTLAFLAVNDAAVQQYGYSAEEFLSMTLKAIHTEEEETRFLQSDDAGGETLRRAGPSATGRKMERLSTWRLRRTT